MRISYVSNFINKKESRSIFLAGPSPRDTGVHNWRLEALDILSKHHFNGSVYVPLTKDGSWLGNYTKQIDWELYHLNMATVIVFWIPRDLITLPGFTTNVEYGMYIKSGKIVLGYPLNSPKMRYLDYLAQLHSVSIHFDLEITLMKAISEVNRLYKK